MRSVGVLLLASVMVLSGCLGSGGDGSDDAGPEAPRPVFYEDDRIRIENISQVEEQAPTLSEAPKWRLGEWWKVEVYDYFVGGMAKTHRVVAGAEKEDYLVGMPTHDFSNDIMVMHVPGFGQVNKTDLSFEVHDCPHSPVKFPLEKDATWETQFECRDVTAEVMEVTETTATIRLLGNSDDITVKYDSEMRAIVLWEKVGYGRYEIVDHGYDFHTTLPDLEGVVTVPHEHDVIFMHGRLAGAVWGDNEVQPTPYDEVVVDATYDRVSFVIIIGNILGLLTGGDDPPVGGYYSERATAPDGTVYSLTMTPEEAASGGLKLGFYKHDKPDGTWQFEHLAIGPGIAMAEGIAYHVYDVELPSGRILPSVGEHQHGDGEGHGGGL